MQRVNLQAVLHAIFPPQCAGCEAPGTGVCTACVPVTPPYRVHLPTLELHALAPYEGRVRKAVHALKSGRRDVADAFADRLCALVAADEIVVPVPTTRARRRERGFDGCERMARQMRFRMGIEVQPHLVQIAGDRQRGRDRNARLRARGRFAWKGPPLYAVRMTLLDDVVTTGATLEDCAAVLRSCGAFVEKAIVIARA